VKLGWYQGRRAMLVCLVEVVHISVDAFVLQLEINVVNMPVGVGIQYLCGSFLYIVGGGKDMISHQRHALSDSYIFCV